MKLPRPSKSLLILPLFFLSSCAELGNMPVGQILNGLPGMVGGQGGLDQATVANGLREALRIGSQRSANTLSRTGGYWDSPAMRIAMPGKLGQVADTLRQFGLSSQVDSLHLAMNRAAETAAGEAVPVFANAINAMTLQDVFGILRGNKTAATDYFYQKTSAELSNRFTPIVRSGMERVGVYSQYKNLVSSPVGSSLAQAFSVPDLEQYVTERALAGLFTTLAGEEARIRENPAARTTELLQKVFGRQ